MSEFQNIKGMNFFNDPWFKRENIEGCIEYVPKDGDIIIASYPKTGTTWLQYIIVQITSKGETFPSFQDILDKVAPFMEMAGPEVIDSLKGVRMYKNHFRYDIVKKNPKSKVLYIYRKPEDVLVSYFHFMESVREGKLNLEEFLEEFLSGKVGYGSYFQHVLSYLKFKDDDNLLLISYEKLHANPKAEILRIAKFLGEKYYQDICTDELLLNKIMNNISFDNMKKHLMFELPRYNPKDNSVESMNTVNFFRKGTVGDGKSLLSEEFRKRLHDKMCEVMKGTEVLEEWMRE